MRKTMLQAVILAGALAGGAAYGEGRLVEGSTKTNFDASPTYSGVKYDCVATGLRKKFIIKVYAVAFCLEAGKAQSTLSEAASKSGGAKDDNERFFDALRDAPVAKAVDMAFVHDVDKGKIAEAFGETLSKSLGNNDKEGQKTFLSLVDRDVKVGDHIILTSQPDGTVSLSIAGHTSKVNDPQVARYIWNAWIGPDSVTPGLKESLARAVR